MGFGSNVSYVNLSCSKFWSLVVPISGHLWYKVGLLIDLVCSYLIIGLCLCESICSCFLFHGATPIELFHTRTCQSIHSGLTTWFSLIFLRLSIYLVLCSCSSHVCCWWMQNLTQIVCCYHVVSICPLVNVCMTSLPLILVWFSFTVVGWTTVLVYAFIVLRNTCANKFKLYFRLHIAICIIIFQIDAPMQAFTFIALIISRVCRSSCRHQLSLNHPFFRIWTKHISPLAFVSKSLFRFKWWHVEHYLPPRIVWSCCQYIFNTSILYIIHD